MFRKWKNFNNDDRIYGMSEIYVNPWEAWAFDDSDAELVETNNRLIQLQEEIGKMKMSFLGRLKLPVAVKERKQLQKSLADLEHSAFCRSIYHSGSHG
jgi:hypothetical protein